MVTVVCNQRAAGTLFDLDLSNDHNCESMVSKKVMVNEWLCGCSTHVALHHSASVSHTRQKI